MIRWTAFALLMVAVMPAGAEETTTYEMIGDIGGRRALVGLYATQREDGGWRLSGEYVILSTLQYRYLEGERSAHLGVTFLREGATPILFGRPASATLQGAWRDGVLKGARYAPGGQLREHFKFNEKFPSMSDYSANVRCAASEARYVSTLAYTVVSGKLDAGSLEWSTGVAPSDHSCVISAVEKVEPLPLDDGLRFAIGDPPQGRKSRCTLTLRDLGDAVKVSADHCGAYCGSQAYFEPVLVEKRGGSCRLLHPQAR